MIVDLVLGMVLVYLNLCILNKVGVKCKLYVKEEFGDLWQGEGISLGCDMDVSFGYDMKVKWLKDWDSSGMFDSSLLKDFSKWDESF